MKRVVSSMAIRKTDLLRPFRPSQVREEWGTMKEVLHECGLADAGKKAGKLRPGETVALLEGHGHEFALMNSEATERMGRLMPAFSREARKAVPLALAVEGIKPVSEFALHGRREIGDILSSGGILRMGVMGRDMILKKTGVWSVASREIENLRRFWEIDRAWNGGELTLEEKNTLLGGLFGYPESAIGTHNGGEETGGTVLGMLRKTAMQDAEITSAACNSTFVPTVKGGKIVEHEFLERCEDALARVMGTELHTLVSAIRKIERMAIYSELSSEIHFAR